MLLFLEMLAIDLWYFPHPTTKILAICDAHAVSIYANLPLHCILEREIGNPSLIFPTSYTIDCWFAHFLKWVFLKLLRH